MRFDEYVDGGLTNTQKVKPDALYIESSTSALYP